MVNSIYGSGTETVRSRISQCVAMSLYLFLLAFVAESSISAGHADDPGGPAKALREIIGESVLADNVRAIRQRAAAMPPTERVEFLSGVIFPLSKHGEIELRGEFSPADPALVEHTTRLADMPEHSELVSPIYDLLAAAKETGQLQQLRDRIDSLPQTNDNQRNKAISSLRLLVSLEQGDHQSSERAADDLLRASTKFPAVSISDMWPEMLAWYRTVNEHHADNLAADILSSISLHSTQAGGPPGRELWQAHLTALENQISARAAGLKSRSGNDPLPLGLSAAMWQPAGRRVSKTLGAGFPDALWTSKEREFHHVSGHDMDFLMYRSPLRGNYELEADLYLPAVTQLAVAGRVVGMSAGGQGIILGTFREGTTVAAIQPHWGTGHSWIRYRAVVRNGSLSVSIDGRPVHSESFSEHHDPWIGFHSGALSSGRVRDIRIMGNPEVPDKVTLSALADLRGWASYHEEPIGDDGVWRWVADQDSSGQIVATSNELLKDALAESLLSYQRPLMENGSVSYEFFYDPKTAAAHPAMDRLAFLIQPSGVSLHRVTDGRYDVTNLSPDNSVEATRVLPEGQQIPLRSQEWNQIKLSVKEDTVTLELNGARICEQRLGPANHRTFGLFRYADSAIRVRNVVMQGDWPRAVPPVSEQPYVDPLIAEIDTRLPQLTSRFNHDFAKYGMPGQYFRLPSGKPVPEATSNGVIHTEVSLDDTWSYSLIHPVIQMHGDFDVTLGFDDLQMPGVHSSAGLGLYIGENHLELIRRRGEPTIERIHATYVSPTPDGQGRREGNEMTIEALAGKFRIVRRGDIVTTLFAEHDSTAFRLIAEQTWDNCRTTPATFDIRTMAYNRSQTQVTWKTLNVAAERLMRLPDPSERVPIVLFSMDVDGTNLQELAAPAKGFILVGSGEYSSDGTKLVADMSDGGVNTSRIVIMNTDGSDMKVLGPGCMPSLSPDNTEIVFSLPGAGITKMKSDGSGRTQIDASGWGTQWSPDGKTIAWAAGNNIVLLDLKTNKRSKLLTAEQSAQLSYIYWNLGWSQNSKSIAFKARKRDGAGSVVAVSDADSATGFGVVYDGPDHINEEFSLSPDGRNVLISLKRTGAPAKLFIVNRDAPNDVKLLPGQPEIWDVYGGDFSPDGKQIAFSATVPPVATEWPQE